MLAESLKHEKASLEYASNLLDFHLFVVILALLLSLISHLREQLGVLGEEVDYIVVALQVAEELLRERVKLSLSNKD